MILRLCRSRRQAESRQWFISVGGLLAMATKAVDTPRAPGDTSLDGHAQKMMVTENRWRHGGSSHDGEPHNHPDRCRGDTVDRLDLRTATSGAGHTVQVVACMLCWNDDMPSKRTEGAVTSRATDTHSCTDPSGGPPGALRGPLRGASL